MGGHGRSKLEIEEERAEALRLQQEIESLQSQAVDLRDALRNLLKSSTPGIHATFSSECKEAERWMDSAVSALGKNDVGNLWETHAEWTTLVKAGEGRLSRLLFCFSERGDGIASDLAKRLVSVRSLFFKHQTECSKWFGEEVDEWRTDIERASRLHDDEHYRQAGRLLDATERRIRGRYAELVELRKQQQSRRYLLKAVRQVCCNMGLREIEPPRLERPENMNSRILLTVASPDKGNLRFALSLDGIRSVGEATQCTKDLRRFSELLSDRFDIRTKFRGVADDDPDLRTAGHRVVPDSRRSHQTA